MQELNPKILKEIDEANNLSKLSKSHEKFFSQFKEIDSLPIQEWKTSHILGYFSKVYFSHYKVNYSFDLKNSPSKMTEVFHIKKLIQMLSSDPQIIKDYIDWIFKDKVQNRKRRITSLGYLSTPDIVNEYKFKFLFNKKIDRSTSLPTHVLEFFSKKNMSPKTYGDLAFLKIAFQSNPNESLSLLFKELSVIFDLNSLEGIQ